MVEEILRISFIEQDRVHKKTEQIPEGFADFIY